MSCPIIFIHKNSVNEKSKSVIYSVRKNKQSYFDKRLVLKVASEIEKELPRKEVIQTYGLNFQTLFSWP
jgi:hypothetical protein